MRGGILLLVFLYCVYATVEWRDESNYSLSISRGIYVAAVLAMVLYSYAKPKEFRLGIQLWTASICILTAINILVEAALLDAVYSPFVVIIILLFLLSSSIIVRLRYVYTCIVCWSTLILWNLICITSFRKGDSTIEGTSTVIKWLLWYEVVLVFTVLVVMKIAHRVEVQSRYEFLTTATWTEKKHKARRQRKQAEVQRKLLESYGAGAAANSITPAAADVQTSDLIDESKDSRQVIVDEHDSIQSPARSPVVANDNERIPTRLDLERSRAASTAAAPRASLSYPASTSIPAAPERVRVSTAEFIDDGADSDEWSDDELDDSEEDEERALHPDDAGMGDEDEDGLESTLQKLNAGLQKRLHDLFFVQQPPEERRQREHDASVEGAEEGRCEEHKHDGDHDEDSIGSHARSAPSTLRSPLTGALVSRSPQRSARTTPHLRSRRVRAGSLSSLGVGSGVDTTLPNGQNGAAAPPSDQMTQITKALTDSGVTDMAAFLQLLGRKNDQVKRRLEYGLEDAANLPKYFLSYPYITAHYRVNFSARMCWQSLFKLHNETMNVWSEFGPALFFFVAFLIVMSQDSVLLAASDTDRVFVSIGLIGALVLRPICSGLAHLLYCQNERSYVLWWGIDYISICVCILCASLVFGRFTFACLPEQQSFFYVSLIGLFLSTIISVVFVSSNGVRTGSFLLFVIFATGVPFWYAVSLKLAGSSENAVPSNYFYLWIISLGCFLLGLIFKSTGFPECFTSVEGCAAKGSFDIFCASHFWWHICINVGNSLAFFVWREYLQWRNENTCGT
jgi:adiponectin receptor